jgi:replicative DNA helicase
MVPIIATTTLAVSDGAESGKRPQLSDMPLGDADVDNVCFIHRDGYYDRDADPHVAELIVASQRNGPADTVRLRWEPQFGHFDNLPEGDDDLA